MARLEPLGPDDLTPEQRDFLAGRPGGRVGGPTSVWYRNLPLARHAGPLLDHLRTSTSLEPRLLELVMLVPVRAWSAEYGWNAHAKLAIEAGIDPAAVEAIRTQGTPQFEREDEAAIYALARELVIDRAVSDATFERAMAVLGEERVIDAVAVAGFYAMVATTLATFDVDLPEGVEKKLKD